MSDDKIKMVDILVESFEDTLGLLELLCLVLTPEQAEQIPGIEAYVRSGRVIIHSWKALRQIYGKEIEAPSFGSNQHH